MNFKVSGRTDFLFTRPSFGSGVARAFDLFGHFDSYNTSSSEEEADQRAIANDWLAVGKDLGQAMDYVDSQ
jgi:hypothetical protein